MEEYIAAQPETSQIVLQQVREVIRQALPEADEVISYQLPAFRVNGRVAIFFAGWKEHFSIYPVNGEMLSSLGQDLPRYRLSKGTVRFPLSEPVPVALIHRIATLLGRS